MTPTDAFFDIADNVTDTVSFMASEIVVGLIVAVGLLLWIISGQREPRHHNADRDRASPRPHVREMNSKVIGGR